MRNSIEHPHKFNKHRQDLHECFDVEQHSESTREALNINPTVEWTARHEQLVEYFAIAVYDADPYERHRYEDIYRTYTATVNAEEIPDDLDDPALKEFAHILLNNPNLAEDFLTRFSNTILISE